MIQTSEGSEAVLQRFNKLITDILRGSLTRNTFKPWEIQILLDIEACGVRRGSRRVTLRRYQRAVERDMERGAQRPIKLSEYLARPSHSRKAAATWNAASANSGTRQIEVAMLNP